MNGSVTPTVIVNGTAVCVPCAEAIGEPRITHVQHQAFAEIDSAAESGTEHGQSALHSIGRAVAAFRTGDHDTAKDAVFDALAYVSEMLARFEAITSELRAFDSLKQDNEK